MSKRSSGQIFNPARKGIGGTTANRHRRQRYAANRTAHSSPAIRVRLWRDDDGNVIKREVIGPVKK